LLEYPQYTRPQSFEGREVPEVLLGGNHAEIAKWRREAAENLTKTRRPDLWTPYEKSKR
jgi:tRNA (guanine37-N1)-methyltransferase